MITFYAFGRIQDEDYFLVQGGTDAVAAKMISVKVHNGNLTFVGFRLDCQACG